MAPSIAEYSSTHISRRQPSFRVGVVSDIQYADVDNKISSAGRLRYYRGTLISLERAVTDWNQTGVDLVLHCGDIIDFINQKQNRSEEALQEVLGRTNLLTMPLKHVVGNHCVYNFSQETLMKKLGIKGELGYYSFQPSIKWRFIILNTSEISAFGYPENHPNKILADKILEEKNPKPVKTDPAGLVGLDRRFCSFNGGVTQAQLDWLRSELNSAQTASQKVIIFTHIPVNPSFVKPATLVWNYDEVLELIQSKSGVVQAVISGHAHEWHYCRDEHNIHHLILPGMVEIDPAMQGHGILDVYDDLLALHGFNWDGPFEMSLMSCNNGDQC